MSEQKKQRAAQANEDRRAQWESNSEKPVDPQEMSVAEYAQKLQSSQMQLDRIRNALDQASIVAVTDRTGVIFYVNDKFCEISGYAREELLGRTHSVVNSGRHPRGFFKDMWRTIGSGKVWRGEICNRTKDGALYWVDTTIVPFLDERGKADQYVSIRTDVTERKRAEEELASTREELTVQRMFSERLSALAALAGGIAHELHQPLSGIRVYAETMRELAKEGNLDAGQVERIMGKITTQVDRAAAVIQHMREFASDDDAAASQAEVINLRELVEGLLDLIGEQMRAHGIVLDLAIDGSLYVSANRIRLEQVLINLVSNAKDSMMECDAQRPRRLRLEGGRTDGRVYLRIADTGLGVPTELRDHIFEPFVTSKGPDRGTGLGLSICLGILRDYDAHVRLVESSDQGSAFELSFPECG